MAGTPLGSSREELLVGGLRSCVLPLIPGNEIGNLLRWNDASLSG